MRRYAASALVVIASIVLNGMVARHAYGQTTTSSSVPVTLPSTTTSSTTSTTVAPVTTSTVVPPASAPRTEIVSISPAPTVPTTTTVAPPAAEATAAAAPPRPLPGPVPIPAQSLGSPEIRALVQALEALAGRAGRLRAAVTDGQGALDGVEQELAERRRAVEEAAATARGLQVALAADEVRLRDLQAQRREASRPTTSPRALPVQRITQSGPDRAAAAGYEQLRRAEDDLVQGIDARRQAVRLAAQRAEESQSAVAATAGEVERRREALVMLREELAGVPSEAELAAGLAAALAADRAAGPSNLALSDIPADYLDLYRRAAATCPGLSWTVLAAIGSVESSHGRADLAGVRTGTNSAGAMGPMQFLAETWAAYGADGDHDGVADVYRPTDSVFGAANYLCASGAGDPSRLAGAIWAYNHADWYVAAVLARAAAYGTTGFGAVPADAEALAGHPNLVLSAEARADVLSGAVDPRVLAALAAAVADHRIEVTVIKTGHSQFVRGTDRVSNHYHGRGVDISSVDGAGVSSSNQAALRLAVGFLTADPSVRPHELGSPWPELAQFPGAFSDADHTGHLHLGWRA